MSTETFWRKIVLFFDKAFFSRLGTLTEAILNFQTKRFCQFCRKLHSTYPEEPFVENSSFEKLGIVLPVPDFEWKNSWILAGKLRHNCRNCTCVYWLRLQVDYFPENCASFLCLFFYFDSFIFFCGWNFSEGCPKLKSLCQGIILRKNICGHYSFSHSSNVFEFEGKVFGLLTTTVPQCCQNCTLCASGTNWVKYCFENKLGLNSFRTSR